MENENMDSGNKSESAPDAVSKPMDGNAETREGEANPEVLALGDYAENKIGENLKNAVLGIKEKLVTPGNILSAKDILMAVAGGLTGANYVQENAIGNLINRITGSAVSARVKEKIETDYIRPAKEGYLGNLRNRIVGGGSGSVGTAS
jgi:hypothetical protein